MQGWSFCDGVINVWKRDAERCQGKFIAYHHVLQIKFSFKITSLKLTKRFYVGKNSKSQSLNCFIFC